MSFDTGLRTIKCWVRVLPRRGVGRPARIVGRIYRTKREASAAKKSGEVLVNLKGMYAQPPRTTGGSHD